MLDPGRETCGRLPHERKSRGTNHEHEFSEACEIVTPQEAVTTIGGKLVNETPAGFSNCGPPNPAADRKEW